MPLFWTNFTNVVEDCDDDEASPVEIAWPEFPWAEEGLTEGAQAYNDAYDETIAANFPSVTRSGLTATGSIQSTVPAVTAGNDIEMLAVLSTTIADMPSSGLTSAWGPDTVDFFVQVTGTVDSTSLGGSTFASHGFAGNPVTVTVSDQGDGLWRIRLENIEDMEINAASNGDGIIEENGTFADVASSSGSFFQGLIASQRYYSRAVDFDIGGTSTLVTVGFMVRFGFT